MVKIQVAGLEATLVQLRHSKVAVKDAAGPAIIAGGEAYRDQVRRYISLRDHSLADLARLGHPYARRHGSIRIHRKKPWQVHRQSGRMVRALRGFPITLGGQTGYEVTFNYGAAPHAAHVIQGTKVMLPRDVLWKAAHDPVTHRAMMKRIVLTLGKVMKSQLGVRFGTTTPSAAFGSGGGASGVR